jgi:hypothetical protein
MACAILFLVGVFKCLRGENAMSRRCVQGGKPLSIFNKGKRCFSHATQMEIDSDAGLTSHIKARRMYEKIKAIKLAGIVSGPDDLRVRVSIDHAPKRQGEKGKRSGRRDRGRSWRSNKRRNR